MIHLSLIADILHNAGFPVSIQRAHIAVEFKNRAVTSTELKAVLGDLYDDGLVRVFVHGKIGLANVVE
jgi:hypothetical protein